VFYDGETCLGGGVIDRCDAPFGGWNVPARAQADA
jgi:hypothetical protein